MPRPNICPGLTPTRAQVASEDATAPARQGRPRDRPRAFFCRTCSAMSSPADISATRCCCRARTSSEQLRQLAADGRLDLGPMTLQRRGKAIHLILNNPRYLNAEDQTTIDAMETAVDIAILDPATQIAVLRGGAGRASEIRGQTHPRQRHQSHPSLSRQDSLHLVPAARPGLRAQVLSRRGAAGHAAGRRARQRHRKALGRGGRDVSRSAATARSC